MAAIYLGRFRRHVMLIDAGNSRAKLIPVSHNYPGFIGISGVDLLLQLYKQAQLYGAECRRGTVTGLVYHEDHFAVTIDNQEVCARSILLCTGLVDRKPEIQADNPSHLERIRYCPVCDGYEGIGKRLGVIGNGEAALRKALFLRTYTKDVFLFGSKKEMSRTTVDEAAKEGIHFRPYPTRIAVVAKGVHIFIGQDVIMLEAVYPALGCQVRSELATRIGAVTSEEGTLLVDSHQQTSVKNLYAAGDVVTDLNQLTVATGHAAIAATAIHKGLGPNPCR